MVGVTDEQAVVGSYAFSAFCTHCPSLIWTGTVWQCPHCIASCSRCLSQPIVPPPRHRVMKPCTRTARPTSRHPFRESLRFIVGQLYHICSMNPPHSSSFLVLSTAFYVQAGNIVYPAPCARHGIHFRRGRMVLKFTGKLSQSLRELRIPQPVSRMLITQPCSTE
jgi:hypothetical protein